MRRRSSLLLLIKRVFFTLLVGVCFVCCRGSFVNFSFRFLFRV